MDKQPGYCFCCLVRKWECFHPSHEVVYYNQEMFATLLCHGQQSHQINPNTVQWRTDTEICHRSPKLSQKHFVLQAGNTVPDVQLDICGQTIPVKAMLNSGDGLLYPKVSREYGIMALPEDVLTKTPRSFRTGAEGTLGFSHLRYATPFTFWRHWKFNQ